MKVKKKKVKQLSQAIQGAVRPQDNYWKLLNLVISPHAPVPPLSPVPRTPNTLSSAEALAPSASPLQGQPRFHHRHRGCFHSPLWRMPLSLCCKGEARRLDKRCQWEAGDEDSLFLLGLEEPFSSAFSVDRGFLRPPSEAAVFSFNQHVSGLMLIIPPAPGYTTCSM